MVSLPETGLLVKFSGIAVASPDGNLNAIIGTRPDIQARPTVESIYKVIDSSL